MVVVAACAKIERANDGGVCHYLPMALQMPNSLKPDTPDVTLRPDDRGPFLKPVERVRMSNAADAGRQLASLPQRLAVDVRNVSLVNLTGFERKFPWQLSGGMQQRVSIARALSFDPALLLMDEPFGALDEIVRDHLNEQLLQLWDKTGKTVLFVTHSIPEAVFLSTKIVVMSPRPGRIIDVIDCNFPRDRSLEIRETPEFLKIAQRVRTGLRAGHSYDE